MGILKWIGITIGIILLVSVVTLLTFREVNQWMLKKESEKVIENGGVSELVELEINGTKQYLFIEGKSEEKPVLLFLHGGPGQPFPFGVGMRGAYPEFTEHFVTVYYDQRGSGKSYFKDIPMESMNIEQFVEDTDIVVEYVKNRFNSNKVIIAGLSWGTIVGTKYSVLQPDKVGAYIGLSQFVNQTENQQLAMDWLIEAAESNEDERMVQDLTSLGQPLLVGEEEELLMKYLSKYGGDNYSDEHTEKSNIFSMIKPALLSPDYSLGDIYKSMLSGPVFSLVKAKQLQAEINEVNLKKEVLELQMPVYIFQGKHDKITNYDLTKEYFEDLSAPAGKYFITLDQSAHYPNEHDFSLINKKLKDISEDWQ
ncbi:alpha/beta fold hydrolase [Bacillus sp. AK128]